MQTMAPPEDALTERLARLDERIVNVGKRVAETNRRVTEGREETNRRFDRVEGDVKDLKKSVESIQATLTRVGIGVALTLASVLLSNGL